MGTSRERLRHINVVGWPRIDRLNYTRFWLPVWMAAVAIALHDQFLPMTLATLATVGIVALVVWEVLRERVKSERVRRQLMAEIGSFVWRQARFEGLRLALVGVVNVPGQTVESVRKALAARHLMFDPLVPTWAVRAAQADLDVTEDVRMFLLHGQAAAEDLNEWERAFSAGEMDTINGANLLRDYDRRRLGVIRWYAVWLKAQGLNWDEFAARQEALLAAPAKPEATSPVPSSGTADEPTAGEIRPK